MGRQPGQARAQAPRRDDTGVCQKHGGKPQQPLGGGAEERGKRSGQPVLSGQLREAALEETNPSFSTRCITSDITHKNAPCYL